MNVLEEMWDRTADSSGSLLDAKVEAIDTALDQISLDMVRHIDEEKIAYGTTKPYRIVVKARLL